ncbi:PH, RCC1 and FYVE domains-containing protein 1-like [Rutidosis leptorrhynchoides]|uniref:PH, RCC1 and FYVE domains-containing protein 1-like n=1 Tax=Rutidosis leptorrhynchoides TaxID=125765 RepID=UPI003A997A5B
MQIRTSAADGFRISVSSTPSCSTSNHTASGHDDIESLGDVFLWGEVWSDVTSTDGSVNTFPSKTDIMYPRLLESNVVIDVQQIACGVRHFSLVTKQGELFTWGEESGGRLGHGFEKDFGRPRLVEFLAVTNVDYVACAEFHTCAISTAGDLYTWGDGSHNAGLLGHGTDTSHWIPKRVSGPLEGLVVSAVACSTWHTALATVDGKLFTFGDGKFGVLGHGDRESVKFPKEVQSLKGLKVLKVACGVWHTVAIIEIANQQGGISTSKKLFSWGDGEKYRLGHGNKDSYLQPTCISALIDYNFHQLACGHTMTLALTTSGHVYSFGSTSYGQLGNPKSDGKVPALVQDELVGEFVEEIACGAYHAACLTSRSEIYTWGMGANGRLGHGDYEDRKTPTLVESLKDRHVKSVSCGASYTASICIHKWVSGVDQSVCSGCKQAFGFTRKRHNCYNCGLVHCHACSSRKALKAAQAPIPGKPHRVCDLCYTKLLKKPEDVGNNSIQNYHRRFSNPDSGRKDRGPGRTSRLLMSPNIEPVKYLEIMSAMYGPKSGSYASSSRASQIPSSQQLKDITFPSSLGGFHNGAKPGGPSSSFQMQTPFLPPPQPPPQPQPQPPPLPMSTNTRPASPYTRRPSPQCSGSPMFSRGVMESLKKSNELLNQEVSKLQTQVKSLKKKTDRQDAEIRKVQSYAQESAELASDSTAKCLVAVDVFKCVQSQLKELTEKMPPETTEDETFKALTSKVDDFLQSDLPTQIASSSKIINKKKYKDEKGKATAQKRSSVDANAESASQPSTSVVRVPRYPQNVERKEVIEQFEPGVYVTLVLLSNGSKIFKRVKFSKRRFVAQQAEEWWKENKERVFKKYTPSKSSNNGATSSNNGATSSASRSQPNSEPSTST